MYPYAKKGRLRHAKEITDRVEGRVSLPVAGEDGEPLEVIIHTIGSSGEGKT